MPQVENFNTLVFISLSYKTNTNSWIKLYCSEAGITNINHNNITSYHILQVAGSDNKKNKPVKAMQSIAFFSFEAMNSTKLLPDFKTLKLWCHKWFWT